MDISTVHVAGQVVTEEATMIQDMVREAGAVAGIETVEIDVGDALPTEMTGTMTAKAVTTRMVDSEQEADVEVQAVGEDGLAASGTATTRRASSGPCPLSRCASLTSTAGIACSTPNGARRYTPTLPRTTAS